MDTTALLVIQTAQAAVAADTAAKPQNKFGTWVISATRRIPLSPVAHYLWIICVHNCAFRAHPGIRPWGVLIPALAASPPNTRICSTILVPEHTRRPERVVLVMSSAALSPQPGEGPGANGPPGGLGAQMMFPMPMMAMPMAFPMANGAAPVPFGALPAGAGATPGVTGASGHEPHQGFAVPLPNGLVATPLGAPHARGPGATYYWCRQPAPGRPQLSIVGRRSPGAGCARWRWVNIASSSVRRSPPHPSVRLRRLRSLFPETNGPWNGPVSTAFEQVAANGPLHSVRPCAWLQGV